MAAQLASGTDGLNLPWPSSIRADIVVINHGINDMTHYRDLDRYRRSLSELAAAPAVVVFETPHVVRYWNVSPFADVMRSVAAER
jgi:hypothetical protein